MYVPSVCLAFQYRSKTSAKRRAAMEAYSKAKHGAAARGTSDVIDREARSRWLSNVNHRGRVLGLMGAHSDE